ALFAVITGIVLVASLKLDQSGVAIIGEVPSGFPAIKLPIFEWDMILMVMPSIFAIALIGFVETVAIAKAMERKHKIYRVDSDQELFALGTANIIGSMFQIFPIAGSFARTAINDQTGARTQLAGAVTGICILIVILFLTPLFYYLPNAILGSVIVVAVYGLFDFKEMKHLWKIDRNDFISLIATFIVTLFAGVEFGILTGVVISLVQVIYKTSKPHYAVLGKLTGSTVYKNVERYTEAEEEDGILIIRPDAPIYFANVEYLRTVLEAEIKRRPDTKRVLVDCVSVSSIDSSALHTIKELIEEYRAKGITFRFIGFIGPIRDVLTKNKMRVIIGKDHTYTTIYDAVLHYRAEYIGDPFHDPRLRARDPLEDTE
ncbi:MAG: SulP family sulfate permease, partial [Limisphaerales bacterium]